MSFDGSPNPTPRQEAPATIGELLTIKAGHNVTLAAMEAEYLEAIRPFQEAYEANRAPIMAQVDEINTRVQARARDLALQVRKLTGKTEGTVHLQDGKAKVTAVAEKKVTWDQEKLLGVFRHIQASGDDPFAYIKAKLSVPEREFKKAAPEVQAAFAPARSVELVEKFSFEMEG